MTEKSLLEHTWENNRVKVEDLMPQGSQRFTFDDGSWGVLNEAENVVRFYCAGKLDAQLLFSVNLTAIAMVGINRTIAQCLMHTYLAGCARGKSNERVRLLPLLRLMSQTITE